MSEGRIYIIILSITTHISCIHFDRYTHARVVDEALNETCRIITGCLRPTPLAALYALAGVVSPVVKREVAYCSEKNKQETPGGRLKSRNSFLRSTFTLSDSSMYAEPAEELPVGHQLPWPIWKTLNRLRSQVGNCRDNMVRLWSRRPNLSDKCLRDLSFQSPTGMVVHDAWCTVHGPWWSGLIIKGTMLTQ